MEDNATDETEKLKEPPTPEDPKSLTVKQGILMYFSCHWKGMVLIITPLLAILVLIPFPPEKYQWCAYCLILMAVFWVTECIPLPVTSFLPVFIFPVVDIMHTHEVCRAYCNDTIIMFLGSLFLAAAVEQSGLHLRVALCTIRLIGYSHYRLLFAVSAVTMFISMWITNTAATTMMVPIVFALLEVFEQNNILKIYRTGADSEQIAEPLTVCYFCATAYSATIGGCGTLVGTATNLVFKGLYEEAYHAEKEHLSFPKFSAFAIPYMLLMEAGMYFCLSVQYLGFLRKKSEAAQRAFMTPEGIEAAKEEVNERSRKLGKITFWEIMVIILFCAAVLMFFCRSPQIFPGIGDRIAESYGIKNKKFLLDSAIAIFIAVLMMLLPGSLLFFDNCRGKNVEDLPQKSVHSVLNWSPMNSVLPWSFIFLLGGGFALSAAASAKYSNLNGKIGQLLKSMKSLPNLVIILFVVIFTVFVTNFASNVAVCNVIAPISMEMAKEIGRNPLWYNIVTGLSSSLCFCLPVGTPGNLIVQSAAKITTKSMIAAGSWSSLWIIFITWLCMSFWAPVIWPVLKL